jgi:4-alpha-glucanotransferase
MAPSRLTDRSRALVREALGVLGKRNLVLGLFDPSYPGAPEDDPGCGSPYRRGGRELLRFASQLGFTGLQLGPQGQTSEDNPSPYDSTLFGRSFLSADLEELSRPDGPWGALLPPSVLEAVVRGRPEGSGARAAHGYAYRALASALRRAWESLHAPGGAPGRFPHAELAAFTAAHRDWLEREALYPVLCREHGAPYWRDWRAADGTPHPDQRLWAPAPGEEAAQGARRAALLARHADALGFHAFCQFVLHGQHGRLRELTRARGLKLFGDLQIGYAAQDVWAYRGLFLPDYLMGAPPSRTNPDGQPWNYPVLDPALLGTPQAPGPALRLVQARMARALEAYDGVRIDHPHGLVDPWVYRADAAGQGDTAAVQAGARLRSSPHLAVHPRLAPFALARPGQLNPDPRVPRHADDWVVALEEGQVAAYAVLVDAVVAAARAHGRAREDLVCEVLSTQPYPLARVMARHGLGRFRVTQKADPHRPADVYRSENAEPPDWVMVGNHDTPPLARVLASLRERPGAWEAQAQMLAERVCPPGARAAGGPARLAAALATSPRRMAEAKFADAFACRAENVFVFFTDLWGHTEVFNAPGTVGAHNWSLRLPPDFEADYLARLEAGEALNLPRVLALALEARGADATAEGARLCAALHAEARLLEPGLPQASRP